MGQGDFFEILETPEISVDRQCRAKIGLGHVCRLRGDFESAIDHLGRSYELAGQHGLPRERALALEYIGDVYRDRELPLQAQEH